MAATYFKLPLLSRKTQKAEDQTSPKPVLNEEAERALEQEIATDKAGDVVEDTSVTKIADDGHETEARPSEAPDSAGQVVVPDTPDTSQDKTTSKKATKFDSIELPSQEEAEAATRSFNAASAPNNPNNAAANEQKTWLSYLSWLTRGNIPSNTNKPPSDSETQTWAQYVRTYVPNLPNTWSLPTKRSTNTSSSTTDEKQDEDDQLTTLLQTLHLTKTNNRLFALQSETQAIFNRFTLVLQDIIRGAPTAYSDLETLLREAGPKLESQFRALPPFVQTLVKSLPTKLAPEVFGAGSAVAAALGAEKPDDQLRAAATEKSTEGGTGKKEKSKSKRRIPGLKSLVSREGAVAAMLRNVVTFLQTRFPFLATGTNVVMSLAVFILMFVFWYCYKRGREERLAQEEAQSAATGSEVPVDDGVDFEDDDDGDDEDDVQVDLDKIKAAQEGGEGTEPGTTEGNVVSTTQEKDLPGSLPVVADSGDQQSGPEADKLST